MGEYFSVTLFFSPSLPHFSFFLCKLPFRKKEKSSRKALCSFLSDQSQICHSEVHFKLCLKIVFQAYAIMKQSVLFVKLNHRLVEKSLKGLTGEGRVHRKHNFVLQEDEASELHRWECNLICPL